MVAGSLLVAAGLGLWTEADWWRGATIFGATVSLVLVALFFNPWLSLAVALDIALIVGIARFD